MKAIILLLASTCLAQNPCTTDAELLAPKIERVTLEKEALATRDVYEKYFGAIRKAVLEGDYMIDIAEIALLSKEHLLMVGPPGTAKTMVADLVLGNMAERSVNGNGSARSFFSIQMTPETTISETHGPFNYQKLTQEGVYERMLHEGMILYRNVFIDEIFDSRANALRNILQALNERRHTQGTRHTEGKIEVTFAATNFYQSQVYEKAGHDGPKAVLDRFAMVAFVPDEFQNMNSYVELIQRAKKDKPQIPTLHFDEIEKIRALVPLVEIPDHVAEFLANLSLRMKRETKNIEQASLKRHKEALQDAEDPIPPYRSTKYHSKRTLQKAAAILKAIVVKDWMLQNGQRELIASFGDIEKLEQFFCMNGPKDEFILQLQNASTDPHERAQMDTILNERKIFRKYYQEILNETNSVVAQEKLVELHAKLDAPRTEAETATLAVELTQMLQDSLDPDAIGGERIGNQMVRQFVEENLNKVFTEEEAQSIKSAAEESPEKLSETLVNIQAKYRAKNPEPSSPEPESPRPEEVSRPRPTTRNPTVLSLDNPLPDTEISPSGVILYHENRAGTPVGWRIANGPTLTNAERALIVDENHFITTEIETGDIRRIYFYSKKGDDFLVKNGINIQDPDPGPNAMYLSADRKTLHVFSKAGNSLDEYDAVSGYHKNSVSLKDFNLNPPFAHLQGDNVALFVAKKTAEHSKQVVRITRAGLPQVTNSRTVPENAVAIGIHDHSLWHYSVESETGSIHALPGGDYSISKDIGPAVSGPNVIFHPETSELIVANDQGLWLMRQNNKVFKIADQLVDGSVRRPVLLDGNRVGYFRYVIEGPSGGTNHWKWEEIDLPTTKAGPATLVFMTAVPRQMRIGQSGDITYSVAKGAVNNDVIVVSKAQRPIQIPLEQGLKVLDLAERFIPTSNGFVVAVTGHHGDYLRRYEIIGDSARHISNIEFPKGALSKANFYLSPDGIHVRVIQLEPKTSITDYDLRSSTERATKKLDYNFSGHSDSCVGNDNVAFITVNGTVLKVPLDGQNLGRIGANTSLLQGVKLIGMRGNTLYYWSPQGKVMALDGDKTTEIASTPIPNVTLTPDGYLLYFQPKEFGMNYVLMKQRIDDDYDASTPPGISADPGA